MSLLSTLSPETIQRASRVNWLVLDVDGVLTDGRIVYAEYGDELKFFDVQDGAGLVIWHRMGLKSAIITSRRSRLVKRRAKELQVDFLAQGCLLKLPIYEQLVKRFRISSEEVCAIGDDLMEFPILQRAGFSVAVPNATEEVRLACHYMTKRSGGHGAVREMIDLILHAKGLWSHVMEHYQ